MSRNIIPPVLLKQVGPRRNGKFDRIADAFSVALLLIAVAAFFGAPMAALALRGMGVL
ncbi:Uncharacterised protein [Mycobacteroides abscessus subsp. bolletii]|uniref:hypothetical protein n=1 Tax=Mycobacteroides abscessus TaxID=36809 RepID=UPI0009272A0D|nr:hypothetical protein [Mycobacteroides abscessus]SHX93285.1 Uncharacterised protein [Mycobacteroides abscessus subsp. bolletii]SKP82192.1 Uncharacterised protein [Mycobacteroides abscessus subsp. bolletii]SKP99759.1 Uncharacterised protein [Mycobacteroides abscessus subsp. bolletii]SKQ16262.1 Uncharacterised protein [Mycobacteroides abscessus subsp. bolletii]SKU71381.1 Uncharacterised protein [Mycobacteroides abscessus subsp. massiliense]